MANSEKQDLMALGKHCQNDSCKQIDFLPFKCDNCSKNFCLNHRKPEHHSCLVKVDKNSVIPQCPLCGKYIVKGINGSDDNRQVELHIQSGCQTNLLEKRKKNRCNHSKCRTISLMPFNCEKCYSSYCVRHRHPDDHGCQQKVRPTMIKVI